MKKKVLVDIGGTNIEIKIINLHDFVFKSFKVNNLNKNQVLDKLANIINGLDANEIKLKISSPTAVDLKTGFCKGISGIEGYANFYLYKELKQRINKKKVEIKALNDANCAMLGMINLNFKTKPKSACLISLGTGIGGAIYLNNQVFSGNDNMAGEFGYSFWNKEETVSLALAPVGVFKKINENLSGEQIFSQYKTNLKVQKIIDKWISDLIRFTNFYVFGLNCEYIFFSGGVAKNTFFQELIRKEYLKALKKLNVDKIITVKIRFFNDDKINYSLEGANFI